MNMHLGDFGSHSARLVALLFAVLILSFAGTGYAHAATCRVGMTATGNGGNWSSTMTLQAALDNTSCTEIWVKAGVYLPVTPVDTANVTVAERDTSFVITHDVAIYGGFAGTIDETTRDARDPAANVTILSGDIDGNDAHAGGSEIDTTSADIVGSNSFHVIVMDGTVTPITSNTVIDGFTITAGHADGNGADQYAGGGLLCKSYPSARCSPTLSHLAMLGNQADYGGAMHLMGSEGTNSTPTLNDVIFSGNSADNYGGALYSGTIRGTNTPILNNVTFNANSADKGGAMYSFASYGVSSAILNNVTFSGNSATWYGGAIVNTVDNGGTCSPVLNNVTFSGNHAEHGGAMFNIGHYGTSSPVLNNVTFSGNSANQMGGAMYNVANDDGMSSPILSNVILWGDTAPIDGPEIYNSFASPSIDHSVVQGGCPSGSTCANLVTTDPLLGPLQDNGGATQTLLPAVGSAAIDGGNAATCSDPATVNSLDQRGLPRPQGIACDIGAVERLVMRADGVCYVWASANGDNDGGSWHNAYLDLQSALRDLSCTEIWVAAGVYVPGTATIDSFQIKRELAIYGGFAGTESRRDQRDAGANVTTLSGVIPAGHSEHVIDIFSLAGAKITANTVIDGFTITGGQASFGGAMLCLANGVGSQCSPVISNVTFSDNHAGQLGGAIYIGAVQGGTCEPTFDSVTFSGNSADNGGALYISSNSGSNRPLFYNVTFSDNSAVVDGAGAGGYGGALFVSAASPYLFNVTLANNSASDVGGGIYYSGPASETLTLNNVILWGNTAANDPQIFSAVPTRTLINHSVVQGSFPGGVWDTSLGVDSGGNTPADPLLGSLAKHGGSTPTLLLGAGSSAINTGSDQCQSVGRLRVDQRGMPRPQGGFCDIGAVEAGYPTNLSVASVSGSGSISAAANPLLLSGSLTGCDGSNPTNCNADYAQSAIVQLNATPAPFWSFVGWGGDCTGTNIHVNVVMDAAKSCNTTFAANADAALTVSIDDARDYAQVGDSLTYAIALSNNGGSGVAAVGVSDVLPPQLAAASAQWQCMPTGGATCTLHGNGNVIDTIDLPAHSSVFYILTAKLQSGSSDTVVNQVGVNTRSGTITDADTTTIVIFRNGFEDSAETGHSRANLWPGMSLDSLSVSNPISLFIDPALQPRRIVTLAARADHSLRVEAIHIGADVWLRLVTRIHGVEQASAWSVVTGPSVSIGLFTTTHGSQHVRLIGTQVDLDVPAA